MTPEHIAKTLWSELEKEPKGSELLVAKIHGLAESTLPDEQRLQVLIHLCGALAQMVYREKRRHEP